MLTLAFIYPPRTAAAREYYDALAELAYMFAGFNVEKSWPDGTYVELLIAAGKAAEAYKAHRDRFGEPAVITGTVNDG